MPYHVRITQSSNNMTEVRLDVTEEQLKNRFICPYEEGRPIVIGGKTISPDDIDRIRINFTEEDSDTLLPIIRNERKNSNVRAMISDEWYVADRGEDLTDDYITGPPGSGLSERNNDEGPDVEGPKVVFVVHGRNLEIRNSMFSFLRAIGLHPLEWSEAIMATGKSSPYIGEILDKAFSIAQAVVVLMTPDDEAYLLEKFRESGEPSHETEPTPQARPNVIFEAGMAMGRDSERTIIVEVGNLRPFSDIGGRHVIRLNNSTQRRQALAQRLQIAGCPVSLSGTDWHSVGDFEIIDQN